MKLQLETYRKKFTVEYENDDLDIHEYLDIFKRLLVQATFNPELIDEAIKELAEEL
jgi:hypothetical protein